MSVLVDFACSRCGGLQEVWVAVPVPTVRACPACGSDAHRRFGGALLRGAAAPTSKPKTGQEPLCQSYPSVPGLCHMVPSAARSWVARARGDNRSLERELAHQESTAASGERDLAAAPVSHDHSPGHGHGHGHGHAHDHGQPTPSTSPPAGEPAAVASP